MNTSGNALAEQMYGSALVTEMSNFAGYLNNKGIDFLFAMGEGS